MAPSPIYMDLPPLEGLTYYKKNSGSDLIKKIELALDEFAKTHSSDDAPLKDFLKSFFSNNKVTLLVNFMHFSTLIRMIHFISDSRHFDVGQPTQGFLS